MKSNPFRSSQFFLCVTCSLVFLITGCEGQPAADSKATGDAAMRKSAAKASESGTASSKEFGIGSAAPPLDIEHWISNRNGQFSEVTTFTSGKVYVVEFWATWCPPCIASMPHLVELQNKYADQGVQIISVSREDLPTVEGLLSQELKNPEDLGQSTYGELTNAYCLTTDPDGSVHTDYMEAANQGGIPCAFVVGKSGLIEWIGHPAKLETTLEKVVAGQWDRDEFALEFKQTKIVEALITEASQLASQGELNGAQKLLESQKAQFSGKPLLQLEEFESKVKLAAIEKVVKSGDIDSAISQIETARNAASEETKLIFDFRLAFLLIQEKRYDRAVTTIDEISEDLPAVGLNAVALKIYQHAAEPNEIPQELQDSAIKVIEKALEENPKSGAMLNTLAHLLHLSGDLERAIEVQTRALENPGRNEARIGAFLKQLQREKSGAADAPGEP